MKKHYFQLNKKTDICPFFVVNTTNHIYEISEINWFLCICITIYSLLDNKRINKQNQSTYFVYISLFSLSTGSFSVELTIA